MDVAAINHTLFMTMQTELRLLKYIEITTVLKKGWRNDESILAWRKHSSTFDESILSGCKIYK